MSTAERIVYLLDANVLLALTLPAHVHHAAAHTWFEARRHRQWATCPLTQLAFARITSNPKTLEHPVSPREAVKRLRALTASKLHEFWPDALNITATTLFDATGLVGYLQLTDAYLLALAQQRGGKLATLDRGIAELLRGGAERSRWIELIPA